LFQNCFDVWILNEKKNPLNLQNFDFSNFTNDNNNNNNNKIDENNKSKLKIVNNDNKNICLLYPILQPLNDNTFIDYNNDHNNKNKNINKLADDDDKNKKI
jgi:hypothetical protein